VRGRHEATVRLLLERGANADVRDKDGGTALHWVAEDGHEATARLLLERGADIDARDKAGWTALYRAVGSRHEAIVRLLLERGPDVDAHWAMESGDEAMVQLLTQFS